MHVWEVEGKARRNKWMNNCITNSIQHMPGQRIETKSKVTKVKEKLTDLWNNLNERIKNTFFSLKTEFSHHLLSKGDKVTFNKHIPTIFFNHIRKTISTESYLSNTIQLENIFLSNNINKEASHSPTPVPLPFFFSCPLHFF